MTTTAGKLIMFPCQGEPTRESPACRAIRTVIDPNNGEVGANFFAKKTQSRLDKDDDPVYDPFP